MEDASHTHRIPSTPLRSDSSVPQRQAMVQQLYDALADVEVAVSDEQAQDAVESCDAYTAFMTAADRRSCCVDVRGHKPIGTGVSAEVRRPGAYS
jgi:CMP-2-keto-3-deoxyoctulosonic acid synthetase